MLVVSDSCVICYPLSLGPRSAPPSHALLFPLVASISIYLYVLCVLHLCTDVVHVMAVKGFSVDQVLGATTTVTASFLEVTVEKLTLQEPTKKPVYVELCACAPKGRASSGIENTVFKTDTVEGIDIAFQSKVPFVDSSVV
jgi:hypothetical protein